MKSAKIITLEIKNYKIFDEIKIDFDQCNVFVGPNSSGKSSIAEFLIFFRELIRQFSGKTKSYFNIKDFLSNAVSIGSYKPLIFKLEMIIDDFYYEYISTLSREISTNTIWANESFTIVQAENNREAFKGTVDIKVNYPRIEGMTSFRGLSFGNSQERIKVGFSYLETNILKYIYQKADKRDMDFYIFNQFYEYWDNIRFYDSNRYDKKKIVESKEISNDIIISEDFKNLISVLLNIYLQQKRVYEEIGEWLNRLLINFRELRIKMSDEKGKGEILFSEENWPKPMLIPIKWASDGIIRLLCILTILFNKEKPTLIILDEPENGFHPSIRNYIVDFSIAASYKSQVIYITHDSESLRHFELEMIYYFKREGRFTEVKRLSEVESLTETIKALKDIKKNTVVSTHSSNSL